MVKSSTTKTAKSDWYRAAFGPLFAAFWTELVPQERVEAEAQFLASTLGVQPGAVLLDVPCGAGRQARALGRLGYRVDGVDISPHMLAASGEGDVAGVTLRLGEMDALDEHAIYDGAYCWGNSFGYLPHARSVAFLQRVAAALKPGARFVLDVAAAAENVLAAFLPRTDFEKEGVRFTADRRYDVAHSAMEIVYRVERGGEFDEFAARQHVYTAAEIVRLAAGAGLALIALHTGIAGDAAELGKPVIGVFARA